MDRAENVVHRLSIVIALLIPLAPTAAAAGHGAHVAPVAKGQGAQLGIYPLGPLPYSRAPFGVPTPGVAAHARAAITPSFPGSSIRRPGFHGRYPTAPVTTFVGSPVIYGAVPYGYEQPIPVPSTTVVYQTLPILVMMPPPAPQSMVQPQYAEGRSEPAADAMTPRANPHPPPPAATTSGGSSLYSWMDDAGNTHLTDRWENVPPGYRDRAKRYPS